MSGPNDIGGFFQDYVFGFIFTDVERELQLAQNGMGGGNFLAALGLLCYTEVLGGVKRGTLAPGQGRKNFDSFFRDLGPAYGGLLDSGFDAYSVVRCGMAHEYLIKGRATIAMLRGVETAGVALAPDGHIYFVVERYYEDFAAAARSLHAALLASPQASLPRELAGS
jgi:hypothetical protein